MSGQDERCRRRTSKSRRLASAHTWHSGGGEISHGRHPAASAVCSPRTKHASEAESIEFGGVELPSCLRGGGAWAGRTTVACGQNRPSAVAWVLDDLGPFDPTDFTIFRLAMLLSPVSEPRAALLVRRSSFVCMGHREPAMPLAAPRNCCASLICRISRLYLRAGRQGGVAHKGHQSPSQSAWPEWNSPEHH